MAKGGGDFRQRWMSLFDSMKSGNMGNAEREWADIGLDIERFIQGSGNGNAGGSTAPRSATRTGRIPQQLLDRSALKTQSPLNVQSTTKGAAIVEGEQTSFDNDSGNNLRRAVVATGESIVPGNGVHVVNNVAYLSDGTDANLKCDGVCVRGAGADRRIYWRPTSGTVVARVKRDTGIDDYGILYQSATAGVFTNNPNESGLAYVQQVGHLDSWVVMPDGSTPDLANISLNICPVGGTSGGQETATAGEDGITAGMWLHLDSYGYAWKADGSLLIRYATHFCVSVSGDTVTATRMPVSVSAFVEAVSPFDPSNTVYLSATTPGYGTTDPPDPSAGTKVIQAVGIMTTLRDSGTGMARVTIGIEQGIFG